MRNTNGWKDGAERGCRAPLFGWKANHRAAAMMKDGGSRLQLGFSIVVSKQAAALACVEFCCCCCSLLLSVSVDREFCLASLSGDEEKGPSLESSFLKLQTSKRRSRQQRGHDGQQRKSPEIQYPFKQTAGSRQQEAKVKRERSRT